MNAMRAIFREGSFIADVHQFLVPALSIALDGFSSLYDIAVFTISEYIVSV